MFGHVFEDVHHPFKREGAHDGAGEIAHAAQNHHHDGVGAEVKAHQLGVHVAGLRGPQIAGHAGQGARQREGGELVAEAAVAHGAHAVFVHPNARERAAKGRKQQAPQKCVDQDQHASVK